MINWPSYKRRYNFNWSFCQILISLYNICLRWSLCPILIFLYNIDLFVQYWSFRSILNSLSDIDFFIQYWSFHSILISLSEVISHRIEWFNWVSYILLNNHVLLNKSWLIERIILHWIEWFISYWTSYILFYRITTSEQLTSFRITFMIVRVSTTRYIILSKGTLGIYIGRY